MACKTLPAMRHFAVLHVSMCNVVLGCNVTIQNPYTHTHLVKVVQTGLCATSKNVALARVSAG